MNIIIYSNCQGIIILSYLKKFINFNNSNHIYNYDLIKKKQQINSELLSNADIFIYQPIDKRHGIYSTNTAIENNILTHLSDSCIKIAFPYIYNAALWPIIPPAIIDNFIGDYKHESNYINFEPIQKLKQKGYSIEKVIKLYNNNEIDFDYENRYKISLKLLKNKEKECHIIVSDFIEENIKKHKLFYTQNHPAMCVFIHCINQILKKLNNDNQLDLFKYGNKPPGFPGHWPSTKYDIDYWKFEYDEPVNNEFYIDHICKIYERY
tara:strand:+ start:8797 stop:9591 length:795 start_codon:yes stop_codon:yes gene_type:complete